MSTTHAPRDWQEWRTARVAAVSHPYGPLALTGTHWLADHPDGTLPGLPGRWYEDGDAVLLRAAAEDRLTVDGVPPAGEVRLGRDAGPEVARVRRGGRHFPVLEREGLWAVREFDPDSAVRRAFTGIEVFPFDERWVCPGVFRPYPQGRTVRVPNVDGVRRGLGLAGELSFTLEGEAHTLQAAVEGDGSLWVVLADATSGTDSYRFRFLRPGAPAADGAVTVDFNRLLLPPCAFTDHFLCPFPPPGNTLRVALRAGERNRSGG